MAANFEDTYEIKSLIGKGGMSTVYLAEHKRLHTQWAVKEVYKNQGKFDFLAESNILKRLQHPMLPRIVDVFEDANRILIVEDYVEGINLADLLKQQNKVDEAQGIQWFRSLCQVLQYLHTQKPNPIVYRDMKPSNIVLQPDGTLKLIDFGIAREYKADSSADTTYIGTKGYAAPEQFGKAQTDARTDIYSLGVTMYHLLTGKSPYQPPYQFVPVRQLNPELSAGIEHILDKCVQSEPEQRYQSVDELLDDLLHSYRYDNAWKKYQRTKKLRVAVVGVMLAGSIGLMAGGQSLMAVERQNEYNRLLEYASTQYIANPNEAINALENARDLLPKRIESYQQQVYALYLAGKYQECISFGESILEKFPEDGLLPANIAAAYFELGEYEKAASYFYESAEKSEMSASYLRDYAVCLGRLGNLDEAERVLNQLIALNAEAPEVLYVRGELAYAKSEYLNAEAYFLDAMSNIDENDALQRRCYLSLAETYRDGGSAISSARTKQIDLLNNALSQAKFHSNTVFYEMLGAAYYERGTMERMNDKSDLAKAAQYFEQVIAMGIQKQYLYVNVFTVRELLGEYQKAGEILNAMETAYPTSYMPHTLRSMLCIIQENQKAQVNRNYNKAYQEYLAAKEKVTSADDTTQLQQLEGYIQQLKTGGWI
ncbi:MAG: protein kinase [Peptococcaceae bacterium]|nr:protein kinase [Peptococcaceae bacterium]